MGDFQQHRASAPSLLAPATSARPKSQRLAQAVTVYDPTIVVENLAASVNQLLVKATLPERVRLLDDFAIAFAQVPHERAIEWSEQLASAWWPTLTDGFGTNSHYGCAAVAGADALVPAVIGADRHE
ncbi:MAG: hypothetical protein NT062_33730 [Proteobacteria bacterium]|nr:hypothetical protein [Pseudomonadota bacterium]